MLWNPEIETMPRHELEKLQVERLRRTVERVYQHVPFYRQKLDEAGIGPAEIRSVADLARLPFTNKQDLRDNYPFGLFAVPKDEIVRVHASSGTTGKMTVVGYTKSDVNTWAEVMARTMACGGVTNKDTVQVAYGYGLFTGGLGAHYGAEKIGAAVIPISGGNTKRQLQIMADFGTTAVACTPSYSLFMAETAAEEGIDLHQLPVRVGFFGAEPWSNAMRREIEEKWGIKAIDIYGLSEVMGPGVASECMVQDGLHVWEDHFMVEVIDPATGEVLPYGEKGELVFTCITKEALPLIRYRTRDISILSNGTCACGRTHLRMHRVMGRTDDMLIIRGVNVFPSQIESVLLEIGETEPHYQLIVDREGNLDDLEIWVEISERLFSDEVRKLEQIEGRIRREIQSTLGISARVKLVEPKTIARSEGKAKRVIDWRDVYSDGNR
ncbi:phenylacetate--CoA ligase family protein [Hydrogenispora ethanolica]|uniref:phenylacetate--CoA ligase family protein n=1 Tax=Hydrogenispora ethanolica TaxID=1082276 RepID=UPI001FB26A31|nr:phenylacetate--CoA ligase [Hydrogenispora ethanolica]